MSIFFIFFFKKKVQSTCLCGLQTRDIGLNHTAPMMTWYQENHTGRDPDLQGEVAVQGLTDLLPICGRVGES